MQETKRSTLTCAGPGGSASETARLTVTAAADLGDLSNINSGNDPCASAEVVCTLYANPNGIFVPYLDIGQGWDRDEVIGRWMRLFWRCFWSG